MPFDPDSLVRLGLNAIVPAKVNGRTNGVSNDPAWDAAYHPCPEAFAGSDVQAGSVRKFEQWGQSRCYPGTIRDLWLYQTP